MEIAITDRRANEASARSAPGPAPRGADLSPATLTRELLTSLVTEFPLNPEEASLVGSPSPGGAEAMEIEASSPNPTGGETALADRPQAACPGGSADPSAWAAL